MGAEERSELAVGAGGVLLEDSCQEQVTLGAVGTFGGKVFRQRGNRECFWSQCGWSKLPWAGVGESLRGWQGQMAHGPWLGKNSRLDSKGEGSRSS